jgi:hypothetical protein
MFCSCVLCLFKTLLFPIEIWRITLEIYVEMNVSFVAKCLLIVSRFSANLESDDSLLWNP